jgi:lysophospholipase L1-like esterase
MGKLKRLSQSLLTLVVTLIIVYLIGEALVFTLCRDRIAILPRYVTDVYHGDFHIRGNVPGSHYRHTSPDGSWEFFINAQGFRDTSYVPYEKPEGELRVLVLGDSFTIGYEVAQDETYAAVLERYLEKKGIDAEVINAGMSGNSTAEELVFLENEGMNYDPDVVVLGFCSNDPQDNIKADLFRLEDGDLILHRHEYVPAIRIRNFLNSFWLYRWLSEHSYLHNYMNTVATRYFRNRLLRTRRDELRQGGGVPDLGREHYETDLARALVRRMCSSTQDGGADFILLDIPPNDLSRSFPWRGAPDDGIIADVFIDTAELLKEYSGLIRLRVAHGGGHWTPFSHLVAATALGDAILNLGHGAAAP